MGIIAANSEYVIAAKALVTPARRMDTTIAGPAPTCPESPEIAVPMAAKIPAPMTAPMPSAVSWRGPSERLSPPPTSLSAMHWSTVLRLKSCALDKERRQHQRDRAQQLDEHVQRRPRRVFERVADGVADHRRLWVGLPFPPYSPVSMNFLALSQAPPPLLSSVAMRMPLIVPTIRNDATVSAPTWNSTLNTRPTAIGIPTASSPGATIALSAPTVTMSTARP